MGKTEYSFPRSLAFETYRDHRENSSEDTEKGLLNFRKNRLSTARLDSDHRPIISGCEIPLSLSGSLSLPQ